MIDPGLVGGISLGGVPPEQKMLKGHLPRVINHQVYLFMKRKVWDEGRGWAHGVGVGSERSDGIVR